LFVHQSSSRGISRWTTQCLHERRWAEIFGDATAVEAMVDRLVHRAKVIVLQGDSYRLKDRTKEVNPPKRR
jgi:DNA replication protein DnaC